MNDFGILPYTSGLWNSTNWFSFDSGIARESVMEKVLRRLGYVLHPIPDGFELYPAVFRIHRAWVPDIARTNAVSSKLRL